MTQPRDPDAIIAAWLEDGPETLPVETRRAIAVGLRTQPRARRMAILGGSSMTPLSRIVAAAAIVFAVGGLTVFVLSNRAGGPGATPAPSVPAASPATAPPTVAPSIMPSATATPVSTAGWVHFSSSRYGYAIDYPTIWAATQSARQWVFATDQKDWLTNAADTFKGSNVRFTAFAVDLPAGTTRDQWIAAYNGPDAQGKQDLCGHQPLDLATKEVDGHPVVFWVEDDTATCGGTAGFVAIDSRLYVFTIWLSRQEPTLEALLSTVTFSP